jgi:serine/threonine protein kinase
MQTPDLYCDECGAANQRNDTICFACQHALNAYPAPPPMFEQTSEEVPTGKRFVLDFATGSVTTTFIKWEAAQTPSELLHNRYKILEQVGSGGFGAVYKAQDMQNRQRLVAIKAILLDTLSASQAIDATDTFNRELSLLSDLDHPHLPGVHEHFIDSNHWYLVMDFIDGEPLDEYLQQRQISSLSLEEAVDIGLQLCDVLRYLHQLKPAIIFRDIKPANIMRTPGGRIYLIDFGIARRFKPGQARDTTPLGSPGFAAPEQYGKAQTTTRTDIYGLGATLYFLLTGYDPANTPFKLPPIASLRPTLPQPLAKLLTSMLALDAANRPANISAIQQVLVNYAAINRHVLTPPRHMAHAATSGKPAPLRVPTPASQQAPVQPTRWSRFSKLIKGFFVMLIISTVLGTGLVSVHFAYKPTFSVPPIIVTVNPQASTPIVHPSAPRYP